MWKWSIIEKWDIRLRYLPLCHFFLLIGYVCPYNCYASTLVVWDAVLLEYLIRACEQVSLILLGKELCHSSNQNCRGVGWKAFVCKYPLLYLKMHD